MPHGIVNDAQQGDFFDFLRKHTEILSCETLEHKNQ